jgi:hypothetical protein
MELHHHTPLIIATVIPLQTLSGRAAEKVSPSIVAAGMAEELRLIAANAERSRREENVGNQLQRNRTGERRTY